MAKNKLWEFADDDGAFCSGSANAVNSLYFPLCNNYPIMSSVSPDLHGDIKTGFNSYLLEPVSRLDLSNLKSSRNFWVYINPGKIWSACGVSKDAGRIKQDEFALKAGLLWHRVTRRNRKIGLQAEITSFIPASGEPVEIMLVEIAVISSKPVKFIPTCAIPLFARSCSNLHDHRHVTSLLQRVKTDKYGVRVTPTLLFDESGHKKNSLSYFVFGVDDKSGPPQHIFPTQEAFTADSSDLEAPLAVFKNLTPGKSSFQGKETMGGLKFMPRLLKPKQRATYIILMGIADGQATAKAVLKKFNTAAKVRQALKDTVAYWQGKSNQIRVSTRSRDFDNWFKWVSVQPDLRRIFGCSFLPDFDYGKGGRGWRDLWQDCLCLILNRPDEIRSLLLNNFSGVRIDGSNATIIGQKPGEFIADRNNISRVWMDHGAWPLATTLLYMHQTGDLDILLKDAAYFRDHQLRRGREIDPGFSPDSGKQLKTRQGDVYQGSILEHILVENLAQFFNVGPHNHIRLEGADWNDGLDMASKNGESVAFSCMYAQNLKELCDLIQRLDRGEFLILKELTILVDSASGDGIDYSDIQAKRLLLEKYLDATRQAVSGEKTAVSKERLVLDLKKKADWTYRHIANNEWLAEGFFNGYYDNDKQRVEGKINGLARMTLTGQVFAVMSGIAADKQVKTLFSNACRFLKDKRLGGFRLNTDFKREQLNLGRAFSFVYGDKENGAFFSHMAVMFAYALYKRGFAKEGYEVLDSIYKMALDTAKSKIYPCLPEYFNAEGRGMYSYLTGSASWYVLTLLTQAFGVRGEYGDLLIEPKLLACQFKPAGSISVKFSFAGNPYRINFINPHKKEYGRYSVNRIALNGNTVAENLRSGRFLFPRSALLSLSVPGENTIEALLD